MQYPHEVPTGTRVDMFIYVMASIAFITTELASIEGILKVVSLCFSIAGFMFIALNQSRIWFDNRKTRKTKKTKKDDETDISETGEFI